MGWKRNVQKYALASVTKFHTLLKAIICMLAYWVDSTSADMCGLYDIAVFEDPNINVRKTYTH